MSATVVYFDYESAETAKKFLDQQEFHTRKIKITYDANRGMMGNMGLVNANDRNP